MAPNRLIPQSGSGLLFMAGAQEEITALFNASVLPLSNIGGTQNAITAEVTPSLTFGVVNGMKFELMPEDNNTGAVTLAIDGNAPIAVKDDDGNPLAAGALRAGRLYLLSAMGGELRAFGTSGSAKVLDYDVLTTNGNYMPPPGTSENALVLVKAWSAGGGGGNLSGSEQSSGGGGGGGYLFLILRGADVIGGVDYTIGAGGAPGAPGGNTTFGPHTVYGGGPGGAVAHSAHRGAGGGAGGGALAAGGSGSTASNNTGPQTGTGGAAGDPSTGRGGNGVSGTGNDNVAGAPGYDGGGGGGGSGGFAGTQTGRSGGGSVNGGGGGGGHRTSGDAAAGGVSKFGGNGGAPGANGQIPGGGGGGGNGSGARGEIRVQVIG